MPVKSAPVQQVPQSLLCWRVVFPAGGSPRPAHVPAPAALPAPATPRIPEVISVLLSWRLSPSLPLFMPLLLLFERNVLTA